MTAATTACPECQQLVEVGGVHGCTGGVWRYADGSEALQDSRRCGFCHGELRADVVHSCPRKDEINERLKPPQVRIQGDGRGGYYVSIDGQEVSGHCVEVKVDRIVGGEVPRITLVLEPFSFLLDSPAKVLLEIMEQDLKDQEDWKRAAEAHASAGGKHSTVQRYLESMHGRHLKQAHFPPVPDGCRPPPPPVPPGEQWKEGLTPEQVERERDMEADRYISSQLWPPEGTVSLAPGERFEATVIHGGVAVHAVKQGNPLLARAKRLMQRIAGVFDAPATTTPPIPWPWDRKKDVDRKDSHPEDMQ